MNRRLFEDLIVSARGKREGSGGLAFPVSVGIHAAIVGGVILLSVFGPSELMPEVTARQVPIFVPAPVVHSAPQAPAVRDPRPRPAAGGHPSGGAPAVRPAAPASIDTADLPDPDQVDPESEGCSGSDCIEGLPPGPPMTSFTTGPEVGQAPSSVVRPGGDIAPPVKIRNVDPVYPELARRAGVAGVVIIECTIDPKGRIASARVLRGHPLLDGAALDAVQQWVYTPTRLNGAPVSVVMTVTVHFKIAR